MDINFSDLVNSKNFSALREKILKKHQSDRNSVGLGLASELTVLQVVALYEPAIANQLLETEIVDLFSASALGKTKDIRNLANSQILSTNVENLTPMGFAILKGQITSVRALLACGDDPNRVLKRIGFFVWETDVLNEAVWFPIHAASTHGYLDNAHLIVQELIDAGADIYANSPLGCSALHLAATYQWTKVMGVLINNGLDVDVRSQPVSESVWTLSTPRGWTMTYNETPLMTCAREGQLNGLRLLLDKKAGVDLTNSINQTALHIAANGWWQENVNIVRELLENGSDKNVTDSAGKTPIDLAKARNFNATVELLEKY